MWFPPPPRLSPPHELWPKERTQDRLGFGCFFIDFTGFSNHNPLLGGDWPNNWSQKPHNQVLLISWHGRTISMAWKTRPHSFTAHGEKIYHRVPSMEEVRLCGYDSFDSDFEFHLYLARRLIFVRLEVTDCREFKLFHSKVLLSMPWWTSLCKLWHSKAGTQKGVSPTVPTK